MDIIIYTMMLLDLVTTLFYTFIVDPIAYLLNITWFISIFTFFASPSIILLNAFSASPLHNSFHNENPTSFSSIHHSTRHNNLHLQLQSKTQLKFLLTIIMFLLTITMKTAPTMMILLLLPLQREPFKSPLLSLCLQREPIPSPIITIIIILCCLQRETSTTPFNITTTMIILILLHLCLFHREILQLQYILWNFLSLLQLVFPSSS